MNDKVNDFCKIKNSPKNARQKAIKEYLANKPDFSSLSQFISHKSVVCKQVSVPLADKSYDKHIVDSDKKFKANKPFSIDLSPSDKENSNWQCFIDVKLNRLVFIVWSLDPELY
jgi:hypothetical protein